MKNILKILFTYILIIIFFLPLIEIILSSVDPEQVMVHVEDPDIVYKFYPEREGIAFTEEYKVNVKIDSLSNRDCQKKENLNQKKILVIGDSFSEGWGVDCEKIYHYGLNKDFQVYNGGIHGGSMPYYILKVRQLQKLIQPDMILIQIFDNDLDDADKVRQFFKWDENYLREANPRGIVGLPSGFISSYIRETSTFRLLKRVINALKGFREPIKYYKISKVPNIPILSHEEAIQKFGKLRNITDYEKEYNGQFAFYKFKNRSELNGDTLWKNRFENFTFQIKQLFSESRKFNTEIELIILYIPSKEALAGYADYKTYLQKNYFLQLLEELSSEEKIKLIDSSIYLSKDPENYYFPGDAHLNAKGHEVLMKALEKETSYLK